MELQTHEPLKFENKTSALRTALVRLAHRVGPNAKLPTMRALTTEFDVSIVTLDRVIRQLESEDVLVCRHGVGIFVSPNLGRKTIGLVFGSNIFEGHASPFYRILLDRCTDRARVGHEEFSFYLDMPQAGVGDGATPVHRDLARDVRTGKLDGLLFTTSGVPEQRQWRRRLTIPTASFLPSVREPATVGIDYGDLVGTGMRQLDAQGCERPALVTVLGFARWRGFDEDLQAYRRALRGRPECIWEHLPDATGDVRESTAQHWREQGEESVAALFASASPPDGLVVTDDMMCLGVLAGLRRLGLVPGRDVHIATHASRGADAMRGQEDLVARLEIDPAGIVEAMFQLLESQMAGDGAPAGAILVKPTLIAPPQEAMEPVGGATHCDASRTDVSILPAGSRVAQSVNTIKEPSTP